MDGFRLCHDGQALRAGDVELLEKMVEAFAVFRKVHGVRGGSEYADSLFVQISAQFDCRLAAEGYYGAVRLLHVYDVLHVLRVEGLEVQPVCGVEVRGDRLGVVVDYDDFVALVLEGPYAVNG